MAYPQAIKGMSDWVVAHMVTYTHSRYPLNRKYIAQVWGSIFSQRKEGGREHRLQRRSQKPARSQSYWLGKEGLGTSVHGSLCTVSSVATEQYVPFTCQVFITRFNFSKNGWLTDRLISQTWVQSCMISGHVYIWTQSEQGRCLHVQLGRMVRV